MGHLAFRSKQNALPSLPSVHKSAIRLVSVPGLSARVKVGMLL